MTHTWKYYFYCESQGKLLSTARRKGCSVRVCLGFDFSSKAFFLFFILPFPPSLMCVAFNLCFQTWHARPTDKGMFCFFFKEGAPALPVLR